MRTKEGQSVENGERLALIAKDIAPLYKNLGDRAKRSIDTLFALSILRLESFKNEEYVQDSSWILAKKNHGGTIANFTNFLDYATSYVNGTSLYGNIRRYQGVLSFNSFRKILAVNHRLYF